MENQTTQGQLPASYDVKPKTSSGLGIAAIILYIAITVFWIWFIIFIIRKLSKIK